MIDSDNIFLNTIETNIKIMDDEKQETIVKQIILHRYKKHLKEALKFAENEMKGKIESKKYINDISIIKLKNK